MTNGTVQFFFAGVEEIKDSALDCTASPTSKAFNESHLRCLCHLMSLALPTITNPQKNYNEFFKNWPRWDANPGPSARRKSRYPQPAGHSVKCRPWVVINTEGYRKTPKATESYRKHCLLNTESHRK